MIASPAMSVAINSSSEYVSLPDSNIDSKYSQLANYHRQELALHDGRHFAIRFDTGGLFSLLLLLSVALDNGVLLSHLHVGASPGFVFSQAFEFRFVSIGS